MERAISMNITKIQRKRINSVRMHLGINYLSKTCNIKGDVLLVPEIENNTHNKEYHSRRLQKPKQNKPKTQSWNLWKRVIQFFTTDSKELKKASKTIDTRTIDTKT